MSAESYSLEHVGQMIDFLDRHIEAGRDTPAMLHALQQRLDIIDMTFKNDPRFAEVYPHMLELQALIFGRRNQDHKALEYMKEAVRQTGSVGLIRSQQIRKYIAAHSQPATAHHHQHQYQQQQQEPQDVQQHHQQPRKRRAGKFGSLLRLKSRGAKVAFAVIAGLLLLSVASFHFVPQVSAFSTILVNHSEISAAKKNFETLTSELTQCSDQLNQERGSVNTSNPSALDSFNTAERQCQSVQQEQNQAALKYDRLIGVH